MIKTLTRHGNSLALVIDKPILELLNIDANTPLEVSTDGERLIVSPSPQRRNGDAFEQALREVNDEFGDVLERLAK